MSSWGKANLADIADLQSGFGFPLHLQGRDSGDLPFFKVGDISRAGRAGRVWLGSADHYIDERDLLELRAKPLPAGAIVFAKIGEAIRQNFRAISSATCLVDNNAMGVIPDERRVDLNFLFRFLNSVDFYQLADKTSVPSIRKSTLSRLTVPLPPLKEQRRIAAILDKADALRQKRRLALQKLDSLTQSIFLEMFGEYLRSDSGTFVPLQNIAEIVSGITKGRPLRGQSAEPVPYLRVANVQAGYLDLAEIKEIEATDDEIARWNLQPGDVVVTEGGDFDKLGRGAVWRGEIKVCIHQNHVFRVRLNQRKLLPDVFHYFLLTQLARNYFLKCAKQTSNLASINMTQLKSLPVFIPPLSLQAKFVKALDRKLSVTRVQDSARKDFCAVFESLQHRAFRGEL